MPSSSLCMTKTTLLIAAFSATLCQSAACKERQIERLRNALRGCVEWVESPYVRGLLTFAHFHAGIKPTEEVLEYGGRVWGEARTALGIEAEPEGSPR